MRDSDRPPVLAYLRFAAVRGSFSGLDLRQRFEQIHRTNLWGAEQSVSGLGSQSDATQELARALPKCWTISASRHCWTRPAAMPPGSARSA
jgi:hypothetical protein